MEEKTEIINNTENYLKENGFLCVEIGYNQKDEVEKLFKKIELKNIYTKKDFGGNDRIVIGKNDKA